MKNTLSIAFYLIALFNSFTSLGQENDSVYLFSYFKGNGDGLHMAYSYDGYKWAALLNDSIIISQRSAKIN
jgi:beta-galactosidase